MTTHSQTSAPTSRNRTLGRRLLAAAAIFLIPVAGATALDAVIADTTGKVEVRLANSGSWSPAQAGQIVPVGATISTSFRASAQLTIGESTLEVEALTRMRIDELIEEAQTDRTDLHLQVGRVRADVRSSAERDTEFRVSSPIAVAAVR
ncbi:MAG TPA: hypothetical protein VJ932_05705, partial [Alkalispirochaeta sp.]|nr:hypothetical protein [Alkalispirochaeta sp.]